MEFHEEIESILGQFCYAFGAGAGHVRVHSAAIRTLQRRYRPYLTANLRSNEGRAEWQRAKHHLLDYVASMGRYSAALALECGDMTILAEHVETAAERFEAAAHRTRTRALKAGIWCPGGHRSDGSRSPQPQTELGRRGWPQGGVGAERPNEEVRQRGGNIRA